jgi:hypothetical protein
MAAFSTWNVFTKRRIFLFVSIYAAMMATNPKYTFYTIKRSLTLAYQYILDKGLGVIRAKIGYNDTYVLYNEKNDVHCFSLPEFVDPL